MPTLWVGPSAVVRGSDFSRPFGTRTEPDLPTQGRGLGLFSGASLRDEDGD